jgi:serine/threonine protein kinase
VASLPTYGVPAIRNFEALHPPADRLSAYAQGRLDELEMDEIERHISACDSCARTIREEPANSLVSKLRDRGAVPAAAPPATQTLAHEPLARQVPSSFVLGAGAAGGLDDPPTLAASLSDSPTVASLPKELTDHSRYRVIAALGTGGMGAVYRAEHTLMDRPVALKAIRADRLGDASMVERFRREAKAAGQLKHPNIVLSHDAEQAGDYHFLVMEYVEGKSLALVVADQGPLPIRLACDYVHQAALGLQYAHERGMVHRDIKPHNLMLTPDGQVKILDFGLARFVMETVPAGSLLAAPANATPLSSCGMSGFGSLTQVGTVMGTPDYIAPEQITDAHTADIRADIYSLGCTLYDLLTGEPPFPERTIIGKVTAHLERMPRPLTELRQDVPAELARVVERMMAKDPTKRFQTPAEVAATLAAFLAPPKPLAPRRLSRRRALLAFTASAGALPLAGIIYVATDYGRLRIEGDVDDVQVVISKSGQEVEVVDTKSGSMVKRLPSGEYRVKLRGDRSNVKLSKQGFTITRGKESVVTVSHQPASNPVVPDARIDLDHLEPGSKVLGYELKKRLVEDFYGPIWTALASGGVQSTIRIERGLDRKDLNLQLQALDLFRSLQHSSLAPLHGYWLIDNRGFPMEPRSRAKANTPGPSALIVASDWFSKTLADRLRECRDAGHTGIPPEELLKYMHEAAVAIDYLNARRHALGERRQLVSIQHRDIKPSNILLTGDNTIKLANTGLFMAMRCENESIPDGSQAMTAAYAPPEFFQGKITTRSDQYCLALTYMMLRTGQLPFADLQLADLIRAKEEGQLNLLALPSEPERAIIARATSVNPAHRWTTCNEMIEAIKRVLGSK